MVLKPFREWSFDRVVLACIGWVAGCIGLTAVWLFYAFRGAFDNVSGSVGIGAVSIGISALLLLVPVGPPIALLAAWFILRRR